MQSPAVAAASVAVAPDETSIDADATEDAPAADTVADAAADAVDAAAVEDASLPPAITPKPEEEENSVIAEKEKEEIPRSEEDPKSPKEAPAVQTPDDGEDVSLPP